MQKLVLVCTALVCSCGVKQSKSAEGIPLDKVSYASTFHFEVIEGQEHVVVDEPWPGSKEKKRYSLDKPLKRIVCTSTSHLPYFELLGLEDLVVGFPNVEYISSEKFNQKVQNGTLLDLGSGNSLNMEALIGLNPDAVIAFDIGTESNTLGKVKEAGIPVYYNSDFLEQSPLGRAEWIKFFGAIFGREKKADSIFAKIESDYNGLKQLTSQVKDRPTILSGVVYGDAWFAPGGQNWAATFFENAGGRYLWENDSTSGWLELSFESVYERSSKADYWLGVSTVKSKKELSGLDVRYESFAPYIQDRVYNYNKKLGPKGGIDFFESGYARPDLVLADLISIIHPQLLPGYETFYFQQLK
ncbi:MAG: ABC transporter substrate-binding protein [Bacteroidota bacterium]